MVDPLSPDFKINPDLLGKFEGTASENFTQLEESAGSLLTGDSLFFLQLQQAIAKESQAYQALSNVQKNRDDAREAAIRNI